MERDGGQTIEISRPWKLNVHYCRVYIYGWHIYAYGSSKKRKIWRKKILIIIIIFILEREPTPELQYTFYNFRIEKTSARAINRPNNIYSLIESGFGHYVYFIFLNEMTALKVSEAVAYVSGVTHKKNLFARISRFHSEYWVINTYFNEYSKICNIYATVSQKYAVYMRFHSNIYI